MATSDSVTLFVGLPLSDCVSVTVGDLDAVAPSFEYDVVEEPDSDQVRVDVTSSVAEKERVCKVVLELVVETVSEND